MPIYDAAMLYKHDGRPLVVIAGKEYGTGSSRDWAAKGTVLLGVRAVIAESFERIHRSNLVGMGVLPLQFREGENAASLGLTGDEKYTITGVADLKPRQDVEVKVTRDDGEEFSFTARCRIDTFNELEYFRRRRHPPVRAAEARGAVSDDEASRHHATAGGRGSRLPRKPDEVTHCNCSLCTKTGFQGRLLLVRRAEDRGRVRQLCSR